MVGLNTPQCCRNIFKTAPQTRILPSGIDSPEILLPQPPNAGIAGMCQDSGFRALKVPTSLSFSSIPEVPGRLLFCTSCRQGYIVFVFLCLSLSLNIMSSEFISVVVGVNFFYHFFMVEEAPLYKYVTVHLLAIVDDDTVNMGRQESLRFAFGLFWGGDMHRGGVADV